MALMNYRFFSGILEKDVAMSLILPEAGIKKGTPMRTVLLLGDYGMDDTSWSRFTNVERLAERYEVAVIMPDGKNGFWCDMNLGAKNGSYLKEECMAAARNLCPLLSVKKEENTVLGVGMGAGAAMRLVLEEDSLFSTAGGVQGDYDLSASMEKTGFDGIEEAVFGQQERWNFEKALEQFRDCPEIYRLETKETKQEKWDVINQGLEEFFRLITK